LSSDQAWTTCRSFPRFQVGTTSKRGSLDCDSWIEKVDFLVFAGLGGEGVRGLRDAVCRMFDEVDKATAIFQMHHAPPVGDDAAFLDLRRIYPMTTILKTGWGSGQVAYAG